MKKVVLITGDLLRQVNLASEPMPPGALPSLTIEDSRSVSGTSRGSSRRSATIRHRTS